MTGTSNPSLLDNVTVEVDGFAFPKAVLEILSMSGAEHASAEAVCAISYAAFQALQATEDATKALHQSHQKLITKPLHAA